jgi:hypothetical protein
MNLNNNIMNKKKCNICDRLFSRQWNLERHLQDVHEINDYIIKEKRNLEIHNYDYFPINMNSNNNQQKKENNNNGMDYNGNSYSYNNFSNTYPNPGYYNGQPYIYSNFNSQIREEKSLSVDDKIRIQKVLKFVENYLEKFYPTSYVVPIISRLHYRCLREKSEEPLKKYLVQNNMGHLWPF